MIEDLTARVKACNACALRAACTRPVPGHGSVPSQLMLVGEAPAETEDKGGMPFIGKGGIELDGYLSRFALLHRSQFRMTNVVRCRPVGNRDPKEGEIAECKRFMDMELALTRPRIVVAAGRFAAQWFIPGIDLSLCHGIPQFGVRVEVGEWAKARMGVEGGLWWEGVVIPVYHPALGLHEGKAMRDLQEDFRVVGEVVRGKWRGVRDEWEGREEYLEEEEGGEG
jgi:uracil-DNA glycosylase family 4